jgi:hypothetical protein
MGRCRSSGMFRKEYENRHHCSCYSHHFRHFWIYFGGYIGVTRIARASNYATLMWLTNIDKNLQQGNIDRAKKLTFLATDGSFGALEQIDTIPLSFLVVVLTGISSKLGMKELHEQIATRAKQHFAPRLDEFSEASKINIQKIVEVELLQSKCSSSNKK